MKINLLLSALLVKCRLRVAGCGLRPARHRPPEADSGEAGGVARCGVLGIILRDEIYKPGTGLNYRPRPRNSKVRGVEIEIFSRTIGEKQSFKTHSVQREMRNAVS
jgi:hypothetical protein